MTLNHMSHHACFENHSLHVEEDLPLVNEVTLGCVRPERKGECGSCFSISVKYVMLFWHKIVFLLFDHQCYK